MDIVQQLKNNGKTVGLITGCFDVIHLGHIKLFRFAKSKVDVVLVGVDSDMSVKLSKGDGRPIFSQKIRALQISAMADVDFTFAIKKNFRFLGTECDMCYGELMARLKPTHIISCVSADASSRQKKIWAKRMNIKFLGQVDVKSSATSEIVKKLESL